MNKVRIPVLISFVLACGMLYGQQDPADVSVLAESADAGAQGTAKESADPVAAPDVENAAHPQIPGLRAQPKRILGIMPNYRAVSAGTIPPPPTPKQAFKIATQNSFDYSSFIFVGVTSLLAEASNAHRKLGHGIEGYGRYYWRGWLDKTDGNYLVVFVLPTIFHQDERYYAMGKGNVFKRAAYASSRILITPGYSGHNTFNASELLGRAMAQGIGTTYYPKSDRTVGSLATKYALALMRDALTNTFRELWPDIAAHLARHRS